MPLQDLTPELRTRLSRVERAVGAFVLLATLLLLTGFVYYLRHTAERKGWFIPKVTYYTYLHTGYGLKTGDPVKLMGFDVGEITRVTAMEPFEPYDVFVEFHIKSPYYGYLWSDSKVKVAAADFLGGRYLEVTKGVTGRATVKEEKQSLFMLADAEKGLYEPIAKRPRYGLDAVESPAVTDQLQALVAKVEAAMPGVLGVTNRINDVLAATATAVTSATTAITNLDATVLSARPVLTNLAVITSQLRDPRGSFGEWLLPTNINRQVQTALTSANTTIVSANTNMVEVAAVLKRTLEDSAQITSNLNAQVQANSVILSEISSLVIHADELMQGLKRNWLLKSSFTGVTNEPVKSIVAPSIGGSR
ncbi:MAG: MlaD family protein [Verrucomicrobia bacterium]|nr:MlaD family protein [Verrucomicrobiota bacterium]